MQIKEERGQVRLIRYVYIKEKGRTVNRQIAKFEGYLDEPPQEVVALLDEGEKAELEAFMAEKRARRDELRKRGAVRQLPEALVNAADAIRDGDAGALLASPHYVDQLLDGLDALKKELRKEGVKITRGPKAAKKKKPVKEQPDMWAGKEVE